MRTGRNLLIVRKRCRWFGRGLVGTNTRRRSRTRRTVRSGEFSHKRRGCGCGSDAACHKLFDCPPELSVRNEFVWQYIGAALGALTGGTRVAAIGAFCELSEQQWAYARVAVALAAARHDHRLAHRLLAQLAEVLLRHFARIRLLRRRCTRRECRVLRFAEMLFLDFASSVRLPSSAKIMNQLLVNQRSSTVGLSN